MVLSPTLRRRLDIQGYTEADDCVLAQTERWLRFSPALCGSIAAIGTVLASPAVLFGLAVAAAPGAVLPFHPFDLIYNLAIRRIARTPELPRNGAPRRFACALGSAWLVATGGLFVAGPALAGYVLGAGFVATAGLITASHVCVPSLVYRAIVRRRDLART